MRTITVRRDAHEAARAALRSALEELAQAHAVVDVFLLAHGNDYVAWAEDLSKDVATRIRVVYDSGCEDAAHAPRWRAVGARSVVAHPGVAPHAPFFYEFLRRWSAGATLAESTVAANDFTRGLYARLSMAGADGPARAYARSHARVAGDSAVRIGDGP